MTENKDPIIIKRYSSRRLYNTATSAYVTLDDITSLIRDNVDIQIIDSKTGEDITRSILLQIISEQERENETILPVNILKDVICAYNGQTESLLPSFLEQSFQAFKEQQNQLLSNFGKNMSASLPGMPDWQASQRQMLEKMFGGWMAAASMSGKHPAAPASEDEDSDQKSDIEDIKKQLAALQEKLSGM